MVESSVVYNTEFEIKVTRVEKPTVEIKTKNGNIVAFWFDWEYGVLQFDKWTCWLVAKTGKYQFIQYKTFNGKGKALTVKAPVFFWQKLGLKLGEQNPLNLSALEFVSQVEIPRSKNFQSSKDAELVGLLAREKEKQDKSQVKKDSRSIF